MHQSCRHSQHPANVALHHSSPAVRRFLCRTPHGRVCASVAATTGAQESTSGRTFEEAARTRTAADAAPHKAPRASYRSNSPRSHSRVDVVALGNLCVDIVIPIDVLPPPDPAYRRELLATLSASPPGQSSWELGANCNMMVAAARIGLQVASAGHVGTDIYAQFLEDQLEAEAIVEMQHIARDAVDPGLSETLLCFVFVDPNSRHAFCSRYDMGPWPLLGGITRLDDGAMQLLRSSRAVFTNGFVFDELPLAVVQGACEDAIRHGSAVFFDPGPRCHTMLSGSRRKALDVVMDLSAVVLMTQEEAEVVTGYTDPAAAAHWILSRSGSTTRWCVVKLGAAGSLVAVRGEAGVCRVAGFQVEVADTVGCGDSFAAAIVLGYIHGYSPEVTLTLGNAIGAATAMGVGAGRNVASADNVHAILNAALSAALAVQHDEDAAEFELRGAAGQLAQTSVQQQRHSSSDSSSGSSRKGDGDSDSPNSPSSNENGNGGSSSKKRSSDVAQWERQVGKDANILQAEWKVQSVGLPAANGSSSNAARRQQLANAIIMLRDSLQRAKSPEVEKVAMAVMQ